MLHRPSSGYGLLRYFEQRLGLQGVVESLVRRQNDVFGRSQRIGVLSFLQKLRRGYEVDGPSKVSNELTECYSCARMFQQARRGKRARADAAAFIGVDCRDCTIQVREFRRPGLAIDLVLCQSKQMAHADPGIILEGQLFRLGPG